MEINNLKIGNVYKIKYRTFYSKDNDLTDVGGIERIEPKRLILLKLNGLHEEISIENIVEISSTRVDASVREAVKKIIKINNFLYEENRKHRELVTEKENEVNGLRNTLIEASGVMDLSTFENKLVLYLESKGYSHFYISGTKNFGEYIFLTESRDIEKYASPEKYSFISREYDGCCFIDNDTKEAKRFAEKYAPTENIKLKKISKAVEKTLELGDKNWLTANTSYVIKLPSGITKKSLQYIEEKI